MTASSILTNHNIAILPTTREKVVSAIEKTSTTHHSLQNIILFDLGLSIRLYRYISQQQGQNKPINSISTLLSLMGSEQLLEQLNKAPTIDNTSNPELFSLYSQAAESMLLAKHIAQQTSANQLDETSATALLQYATPLSLQLDKQPVASNVYDQLALHGEIAEQFYFPELSRLCGNMGASINNQTQACLLATELTQNIGHIGWTHPATLASIDAIANKLGIDEDEATSWVHSKVASAAQELHQHSLQSSIFSLITLPRVEKEKKKKPVALQDYLNATVKKMHGSLPVKRVMFAVLSADRQAIQARFTLGDKADGNLQKLQLSLTDNNLFQLLSSKPSAIYVDENNYQKYQHVIPQALANQINSQNFIATSLFINKKAIGLFYADSDNADDLEQAFPSFKQYCQQISDHLASKLSA